MIALATTIAADGRPYRPSNGTEGEMFMGQFCHRCQRDAAHRADPEDGLGCPIIVYSMAYSIGDPEYPPEWVEDDAGPRCTAFEPETAS